MIRLDFPGYSGAESLQPISWPQWFRQFDENNLALLVQEKTSRGQTSNFNKLVNRTSARGRSGARKQARSSRAKRQAGAAGSRKRTGAARPQKRAGAARSRKQTAKGRARKSARRTARRRAS